MNRVPAARARSIKSVTARTLSFKPVADILKLRMVKHRTISTVFFLTLLLLQTAQSERATLTQAQTTVASDSYVQERERGKELYRQQKFPEAAKLFQELVKKDRRNEEAWHYLGMALLHQPKEMKAATKAFETALKLQPNSAPARAGLSYSLMLRNKLSEAMREAQAALRIQPNIPEAHYVIGVVRLRTDEKQEAVEQADTVIKLSPEFAPAYLLKSLALASSFGDVIFMKENESVEDRNSRFKQAADALEKYLQLDPNAEDEQTWTEQLESLRFYIKERTGKPSVFPAKGVTVKARILSKPEPSYTERARAAGVTGTVVLRAVFTADGTVKHFIVVKSLPYGLTEASLAAARKIKFVPASVEGKPVAMYIQLEYNFNIF